MVKFQKYNRRTGGAGLQRSAQKLTSKRSDLIVDELQAQTCERSLDKLADRAQALVLAVSLPKTYALAMGISIFRMRKLNNE